MHIPPVNHPAYWDLVHVVAEDYADAHANHDLEEIRECIGSVRDWYGHSSFVDVAAVLLARIRTADPTTPGAVIVATTRENTDVSRLREDTPIAEDVTHAPYQIAAVDQIAPVMADAMELDHYDVRSIASFMHSKMPTPPDIRFNALVALAGGALSHARGRAIKDLINNYPS